MILSPDGTVVVVAPQVPTVRAAAPVPPTVTVVPAVGPPGAPGPPGDSTASLSYTHIQSVPSTLVQIVHGLIFQPAAVLAMESDSTIVEPSSVSYPQVGVVEVGFGFGFTGTIRLS